MEMGGNECNWLFTNEELENSPSRQCGLDSNKELSYRQLAANLICDMAKKLYVSTLVANTAVVYMHRFYMYHSFTNFQWQNMAAATLFLSSKVEEQPRKLDHFIKLLNSLCSTDPTSVNLDVKSEQYNNQAQDLIFNEHILLLTMGFDVAVDHPHAAVVKSCELIKAPNDLSKMSYMMATFTINASTMCIQYRPTMVACFCIYVSSKWSRWEIQLSNEQKQWFTYVDSDASEELLENMTKDFLVVFDKCPLKLLKKFHFHMNASSVAISKQNNNLTPHSSSSNVEALKAKLESAEQRHSSHHIYHQSHHQRTDKNSSRNPNAALNSSHKSSSSTHHSGQLQKLNQIKPTSHHPQNVPHSDSKSHSRPPPLIPNLHDKHSSSSSHRVNSTSSSTKENVELKRFLTNNELNEKKDALKVRPNHNANSLDLAAKKHSSSHVHDGSTHRSGSSHKSSIVQSDIKNSLSRTDLKAKGVSESIPTTTVGVSTTTVTTPATITITLDKYFETRSHLNTSKVPPVKIETKSPTAMNEPHLPLQTQSETQSTISSILKDVPKVCDFVKPFNSNQIVNGIETDPMAISSLLKESSTDSTISALSINVSSFPVSMIKTEPKLEDVNNLLPPYTNIVQPIKDEFEQKPEISKLLTDDELSSSRHDKKKKKEKHKHKDRTKDKDKSKDKHKDKDRSKDEKKRKHKDKHRSKNSKSTDSNSDSLKITISKSNSDDLMDVSNGMKTGIKIKIPKDRIKSEMAVSPNLSENNESSNTGSLKIKIKKDRIQESLTADSSSNSIVTNISDIANGVLPTNFDMSKYQNYRKRDRGTISPSSLSKHHQHHHFSEPPSKIMRVHSSNQTYDSIKANTTNSFQKISENFEDITSSVTKSIDSKNHRKGSSSNKL